MWLTRGSAGTVADELVTPAPNTIGLDPTETADGLEVTGSRSVEPKCQPRTKLADVHISIAINPA
jgi:hypothetical protein